MRCRRMLVPLLFTLVIVGLHVGLNGQSAPSELVIRTPIEGGPGWINSEAYMIEATAAGAPTRPLMMGPMLQTLLEDRFRLRVRRESREIPVYALTIASGAIP